MAGMVKAYNLNIDYVLNEISYVNLMMYSAVLPHYDDLDENNDGGTMINADSPHNRQMVEQILFG
mgnify:CR=1 FL=1